MNEEPKRPKQITFTNIVSMIVLAAIAWVGLSIQSGNEKLSRVSERLAAIEATATARAESQNRMELQLNHLQDQVKDMAVEFARIKSGKP